MIYYLTITIYNSWQKAYNPFIVFISCSPSPMVYLAYKDYPIESIGYDEYRQTLLILQLHAFCYLRSDTVRIYAINNGRGKPGNGLLRG